MCRVGAVVRRRSGLRKQWRFGLGNQLVDHVPRHVGQAERAALELERQLQVVEAEQVEDGGVEVVDVGAVVGGVEAERVGVAVDVAGLGAAAA